MCFGDRVWTKTLAAGRTGGEGGRMAKAMEAFGLWLQTVKEKEEWMNDPG